MDQVNYIPPARHLSSSSPLRQFLYHKDGAPRKLSPIISDDVTTKRGVSFCIKSNRKFILTNPLNQIEVRKITLDTGTKIILWIFPTNRLVGHTELRRDWSIYKKKGWADTRLQCQLPSNARAWRAFLKGIASGGKFMVNASSWELDRRAELIRQYDDGNFTITFEEFATVLSIIKMVSRKQ